MPSKFGGIPVSNNVPASKFGGVPVSDTPAPAPPEPGIVSKLTNFVTRTLDKTAQNMNVENLLHAVDEVGDSIRNGTFSVKDTINKLDPSLGKLEDDTRAKLANKDYSGATANVLPLAMGAYGGEGAEATANAARSASEVAGNAAQATAKYGARVAENAPTVVKAAGKVAGAAGPQVGKAVAASFIPGIGKPISVGMLFHTAAQVAKGGSLAELGDAISGILKPTKAEIMEGSNARAANTPWKSIPDPVQGAEAAPAEVDANLPSGRQAGGIQNQKDISPRPLGARQAPVWKGIPDTQPVTSSAPTTPQESVTLPSGRVIGKPRTDAAQPLPTSKVQIPTKFSAESVTDTAGTSAPKPASAAPAPAAPDLNAATTKRLAEATQTGKLDALPSADKSALVKAVKAGDNEAVHSILDKHGAVDRTRQAVIDKVQVLAKYAQDHGIDLETIAPEDRQSLANAAWAHGSKNGLKVPKSGYRSISDDTYNMVKDKVAGK